MMPLFYSTLGAKELGQGWYRNGYDIVYYPTTGTNVAAA